MCLVHHQRYQTDSRTAEFVLSQSQTVTQSLSPLVSNQMSSPTSPTSEHTPITSPSQDDNTSDIWASDSSHPPSPNTRHPHAQASAPLSDLPSLRRQHITSGYREGLSIGKATVIQSGFDSGYPIGVEIALRAGKVIGLLEGMVAALAKVEAGERREKVKAMLEKAKREMDVKELLRGVEDEVVAREGGLLEVVGGMLGRWEREAEEVFETV